jgi:hypothetical protein
MQSIREGELKAQASPTPQHGVQVKVVDSESGSTTAAGCSNVPSNQNDQYLALLEFSSLKHERTYLRLPGGISYAIHQKR